MYLELHVNQPYAVLYMVHTGIYCTYCIGYTLLLQLLKLVSKELQLGRSHLEE